jgi:hypothetical protein
MENTFSDDFKKIFLLAFTIELIRHSKNKDITKLQKIIELEESRKKENAPSVFPIEYIPAPKKLEQSISIPERKILSRTTIAPKSPRLKQFTKQVSRPALIIPEPKLPSHLEYLRPAPAPSVEIDLSKINPLIKDPAVRVIEGNPDEKVVVTGSMGTKPTTIVLNKEDIDRIINKFSEVSKIPVSEGIYRVVVGNLTLSAVISEIVGSRFVIKKIIAPREQPSPQLMPKPMNNNFMPTKSSFGQLLKH